MQTLFAVASFIAWLFCAAVDVPKGDGFSCDGPQVVDVRPF
jgi:hypothetical protein